MCINPKTIAVQTGAKARGYKDYKLVPCGECIECQKDRQNEIAVMCHRTAEAYGSMQFVTLTYNNDHLPMYYRVFDEETGEAVGDSIRLTPNYEKQAREQYLNSNKDTLRTMTFEISDEEGSFYTEVSPSLSREDIKEWLKVARIYYKRKYKENLPEFKYIVCGEYGPRTGRPHFHCGFFGLSKEQVDFLCRFWKNGFYECDEVIRFNSNDHTQNGWIAAAKYIGKYISKGKFEDPRVKQGAVEKPRKQASIHFGYKDDLQTLRSYHLCYDLFGEYDPNDEKFLNNLSKDKQELLFNEIIKRKKYKMNGLNYKLPRAISRQIFYYREKDPFDTENKIHERATRLQKMVSSFVQRNLHKNFNTELQSLRDEFSDEVPFEEVRSLVHRIYHPNPDRTKVVEKNIIRQYQKSVF